MLVPYSVLATPNLPVADITKTMLRSLGRTR